MLVGLYDMRGLLDSLVDQMPPLMPGRNGVALATETGSGLAWGTMIGRGCYG